MKKWLAAILAATMCIACFAGCTGGKDADTASQYKEAADADDITITVWSGDGGGQAVWQRLVKDWNTTTGDEKNIFINFSVSMDSSRTDVAQQNGTLPEITNANTTQMKKFIPNGDLIPLNDLPGGEEFLKEYDQAGVENRNVFNGKQYSVWRKAITAGVIYNKDLFKKAGITKVPTTIAEMREAAKKITDVKAGIYGFAFPLKFGLGYTLNAHTSSSFSPENPVTPIDLENLTIDYSNYKEMHQWILDIKDDGSLFPGAETLDNDTARAYFAQGIIGMIPAISWDVGVYTTQFVIGDNFEWDVFEFPLLDSCEQPGFNYQTISGGFTVSKNALKTPEIAAATMEAYKFLYDINTRKTLFEEGIELSCKTDVLEVVDMDKVHPVFAKFASYINEDFKHYQSPGNYIVEGKTWGELFDEVWSGKTTLDKAIADYQKRASEGLKDGVKDGTYDVELAKQIQAEKLADWEAHKKLVAEKAAK